MEQAGLRAADLSEVSKLLVANSELSADETPPSVGGSAGGELEPITHERRWACRLTYPTPFKGNELDGILSEYACEVNRTAKDERGAEMKVIVAGSRTILNKDTVRKAVRNSGFLVTEVVSGKAQGVDRLGEELAVEEGWPIVQFPADWNEDGRSAGPLRNSRMASYADALVAVWDGQSRGTQDMIRRMEVLRKPVYVYKAVVEDDGNA